MIGGRPSQFWTRPFRRMEELLQRLFVGTVAPKTVAILLQQLALMLESGVPIADAFDSLRLQYQHPVLDEVLDDLVQKVGLGGWKMSAALSRHPELFPPYVVMFARAGETGGNLAGRLRRAGELMERSSNLNAQVRTALTGPALTVLFSSIVLYLVVKFVMPRFLGLYDQMHLELPLLSQFVIGLVRTVNSPLFLFTVLTLAAVLYAQRRPVREKLFSVALYLPRIRLWVGTVLCAELCDVLASLIEEGVPILQALKMIAETTPRALHKRKLREVVERLRSEGRMADAFDGLDYFPPMFQQICAVSEETGSLDQMLRSVHHLLEQQVELVISSVVNLVEPITISILGVVMGGLFVGMFLPVYGLLQNLGS